MAGPRTATIRSFAKINLDLRVLHKRPDGFHELRTVFQTISLADTIHIEYTASRTTRFAITGSVDIPDNLILRAAQALFHHARAAGRVQFHLNKRIPMGGGLGGGSSNAAAVLLALPSLAGLKVATEDLRKIGAALGSDVPFFLLGGTAAAIGRGTELFPLPDLPAITAVLAAPGIHVSTAEAYQALARRPAAALTTNRHDSDTGSFQDLAWSLGNGSARDEWRTLCVNDFESAVFSRHPQLENVKRTFERFGARPALMSGSGSSVFGLFESRDEAERARRALSSRLPGMLAFPISFVSRRRYRAIWLRQLEGHTINKLWPPQSRYAR